MIKLPSRVSLVLPFFSLMLAGASASAQTIYVRAGKLVDPTTGTVRSDQMLRIEDSKIAAVGPYAAPPKGSIVTDWSAYTVLPGLIDMHTHLVDTEQDRVPTRGVTDRAVSTISSRAGSIRRPLLAD